MSTFFCNPPSIKLRKYVKTKIKQIKNKVLETKGDKFSLTLLIFKSYTFLKYLISVNPSGFFGGEEFYHPPPELILPILLLYLVTIVSYLLLLSVSLISLRKLVFFEWE